MRSFSKLLPLPAVLLLAAVPSFAQSTPTYNVGTPATTEDIKALDLWVAPDGKGLSPGSGTAKQGQALFAQRCAMCHGPNGEGGTPGSISDPYGVGPKLVGGVGTSSSTDKGKKPVKTVGSFWSSAPAIWEFINRAMPQNAPGTLKSDQVYAALAFILFRNGIIKEDTVLDAKTTAAVQMPNKDGFLPAVPTYPEPAKEDGGCGSRSCTKVQN